MSGNKIVFLLVGLVCALIAALMVGNYMTESSKRLNAAEVPKEYVVVAKTNIDARNVISAEQVELKSIPKEAIYPDSATKLEQVVGLTTKSDLLQGEQINTNRLLKKGDKVELSFLLAPGMRAISVAINEIIGVAGFVKPGEHVDVLSTFDLKEINSGNDQGSLTWTVLQNIEVLAISQEMVAPVTDPKSNTNSPDNKPKLGTSVTLAVTPYQAEKLTLAEEKGKLRLALRPAVKEIDQKVAPVRDLTMIPVEIAPQQSKSQPVTPSQPVQPPQPKGKEIQVISGNKIDVITVY